MYALARKAVIESYCCPAAIVKLDTRARVLRARGGSGPWDKGRSLHRVVWPGLVVLLVSIAVLSSGLPVVPEAGLGSGSEPQPWQGGRPKHRVQGGEEECLSSNHR